MRNVLTTDPAPAERMMTGSVDRRVCSIAECQLEEATQAGGLRYSRPAVCATR